MANFYFSEWGIFNGYLATSLGPSEALVVLNDDQCTGSRVEKYLTATDRRGRRTRYENRSARPVFVIVDGDRGFTRKGEPVVSHIRDAVPARANGERPAAPSFAKPFPRLRKACHKAGWDTICVPGGEPPFRYEDEILVPDFSDQGTSWFLVPRKVISQLLAD